MIAIEQNHANPVANLHVGDDSSPGLTFNMRCCNTNSA